MAAAQLKFTGPPRGKYAADIRDIEKPMARAATGAFRDGAKLVQSQGRALILGAKLGSRFASQFKVFVFPRKQFSLNPTMRGFHARGFVRSKIGRWANVFAHGAVIRPVRRPLLWFPLPTAPRRIAGRRPTIPLYLQHVGPLKYIKRPGKHPILVAEALRAIRGRASTIGQLQAGTRHSTSRRSGGRAGALRGKALPKRARPTFIVPIFVGVPETRIKQRVDIEAVFAQVALSLPSLYDRRLNETA